MDQTASVRSLFDDLAGGLPGAGARAPAGAERARRAGSFGEALRLLRGEKRAPEPPADGLDAEPRQGPRTFGQALSLLAGKVPQAEARRFVSTATRSPVLTVQELIDSSQF